MRRAEDQTESCAARSTKEAWAGEDLVVEHGKVGEGCAAGEDLVAAHSGISVRGGGDDPGPLV